MDRFDEEPKGLRENDEHLGKMLGELKAEEKRLTQQVDRDQQRLHRSRAKLEKVKEKIRHLERKELLLPLIGQPGAVHVAFPLPAESKGSELNDKAGTLLEVHRTRCVVEFDGKQWDLSLSDILPSNQQQGFEVAL
jgi:hypothetical protein